MKVVRGATFRSFARCATKGLLKGTWRLTMEHFEKMVYYIDDRNPGKLFKQKSNVIWSVSDEHLFIHYMLGK